MTKKKVSKVFVIGGTIITILISFLLAAPYETSKGISVYSKNINEIIDKPSLLLNTKYFNKNLLIAESIGLTIWFLYVVYKIFCTRNYHKDEYGSAKIETPENACKKLENKNKDVNTEGFVKIPYNTIGKKELQQYINTRNRLISDNIRMDIVGRGTHELNANILIIGGSGAGKTQWWVRPNAMQLNSSYVFTDSKGELVKTLAPMFLKMGYKVKVLNIMNAQGMIKSNRYNPFEYIKNEIDIDIMCDSIIKNSKDEKQQSQDPFWENAPYLLLKAILLYTWLEAKNKNMRTVMELLQKADFKESMPGKKVASELDQIFEQLEKKSKRENQLKTGVEKCTHPAVLNYNKVMKGAADTVRSIIQSVDAFLKCMTSKEILDLMETDEMNFEEIGAGANYDGKTKTALFCVIPDNKTTFNFVIGLFYNQLFNILYNYADFMTDKGSLPLHVAFILDEFANVPLPQDYLKLLATMRSRNISSTIIIQNFSQIKKMYPNEEWEAIPGNSDTIIYLGGNEKSTHKYMSESVGKGTFDKQSSSETKSKQGSSSKSYDRYGRELLTEDEVKKLKNEECLIFIRGMDAIKDKKIKTLKHPLWPLVESANYIHDARKDRNKKRIYVKQITSGEYKTRKRKEEYDNEILTEEEKTHDVIDITYEEIMSINETDLKQVLKNQQYLTAEEIKNNNSIKTKTDILSVMELRKLGYSLEQIEALNDFINEKGVKKVINNLSPDMDVTELVAYAEYIN